ncbi:MAG: peroxiredoxin family protein [Acidobacteriia bacterium]|nr:peroxiredoxin family protein [Terriglobia bacterium]
MRNLQANYKKLEDADTQVVGVSMDSPFANKAFGDSLGVNFPIASDWFDEGAATKEYGLWEPKYKAARRATFLVGKDGKIEEIQVDREAVDPTKVVTACERKKHS